MTNPPNEDLAALMGEARCSRKALARDVRELGLARDLRLRCDHVDVGRWLAGMRPRGAKPELIASALGRRLGRLVTLAEIGMDSPSEPPLRLGLDFADTRHAVLRTARKLWTEDLKRTDFLRHGVVTAAMLTTPVMRWLLAPPAPGGPVSGRSIRVGASDVEAVRATVRMFEDLDHRFGGGHARTAAVQYLASEVNPLLHGNYTEAVGRSLFAVTAQFTYKTGAMAYDMGLHGLARRYFVQALSLAHASGDRALGGKVLALMSHQANFCGEHAEAVDLARAAKLGGKGHATPTVQAMYCAMEARALASQGDKRACVRALREAEAAFARRNPADDPDWIAYFDQAEFHDEFGHCFRALRQAADTVYHASLSLDVSAEVYARSRTFCRLTLAGAHLDRRDVEQACAVASEALGFVDRLKSARVRAYLSDFDRRLAPYTRVPAAAGFRGRAAALLGAA
jgi:hypothetical protein